MIITLIINSLLLGIGLAMDAFSVSLANGLNNPKLCKNKALGIAGVFAIFQGLMPLIGWICVHTVVQYFSSFEKFIPWIALALLSYIGINMIRESVGSKNEEEECASKLTFGLLMVQGVATSIDALSVGFTIAEYALTEALLSVAIIAVVTLLICFAGILIGQKAGTKLAGKSGIIGGSILIFIGLEIFITGIF